MVLLELALSVVLYPEFQSSSINLQDNVMIKEGRQKVLKKSN